MPTNTVDCRVNTRIIKTCLIGLRVRGDLGRMILLCYFCRDPSRRKVAVGGAWVVMLLRAKFSLDETGNIT